MTACSRALLAAWLGLVAVSGCRCDTFEFYEVIRTPTEECDILPSGEFCNPEGLSAPTFEIWSVEHVGEDVRVIVDEEVWIGVLDTQNPDRITSSKKEVASVAPGPCTTTTTRSFDILVDGAALTGTILGEQVLTGPDDCGEVPRGLRSAATLAGNIAGAP